MDLVKNISDFYESNKKLQLESVVDVHADLEIFKSVVLNTLSFAEDKDDFEKSFSSDLSKRFPNGSWRTINGAKVFVNGGKVVAGLDGFNKEIDKFFDKKKTEGKKDSGKEETPTQADSRSLLKFIEALQTTQNKESVSYKSKANSNLTYHIEKLDNFGTKMQASITANGHIVESFVGTPKEVMENWHLKDQGDISDEDKNNTPTKTGNKTADKKEPSKFTDSQQNVISNTVNATFDKIGRNRQFKNLDEAKSYIRNIVDNQWTGDQKRMGQEVLNRLDGENSVRKEKRKAELAEAKKFKESGQIAKPKSSPIDNDHFQKMVKATKTLLDKVYNKDKVKEAFKENPTGVVWDIVHQIGVQKRIADDDPRAGKRVLDHDQDWQIYGNDRTSNVHDSHVESAMKHILRNI